MAINPEIHPELHQEFHFAEGTEVTSNCCFACWRSRPKQPVEYTVNKDLEIKPQYRECDHKKRIIANQRLARIIKGKFDDDAIANNDAFELLKSRINDPMENGDPITEEKLERIVNEIYKMKSELKTSGLHKISDS